ncbi:MAG: RnfABCDGE type electron transport complex subunit D [Actinomycetota bacterium]|nr:RnfABCDGE type electron transport complex subunit D [Actinomycetota bacterium]
MLPSLRDPRLKLSAVIISLQVLGQTVLGFKVSIAQILVTVGVCAIVDTAVTMRRQRMLVWPASALLTGNSVAFILRASGTRHGDWWTLHGIQYFILAGMLALLSKYLLQTGRRHLFNPSNVGLVWTLLIIGPVHVFPQYLWWGPLGVPVVLALVVIFLGALWILKAVGMFAMAGTFWVTLATFVAIFALAGRSFIAIWHPGPISGFAYWRDICFSPELLIFVFFMMSDPKTSPRTRLGRMIYGAATAILAAGLLVWQPTEFGVKVSILASLTVVCALVPLIEAIAKRTAAPVSDAPEGERRRSSWPSALGARGWRNPALVAAALIAIAAPIDTLALTGNKQIGLIEQGLTGSKNAQ